MLTLSEFVGRCRIAVCVFAAASFVVGFPALTQRAEEAQAVGGSLPALSGTEAIEYLKQNRQYDSLMEAFAATRKGQADETPTNDAFEQTAKLTASDGAGGAGFGTSVAISGDTAIVGAPTLGNYPATVVDLSDNITVTPDAAPTGVTSITVSTSTSFNAELTADVATGVVRLTNAQPARLPPGAYTVTVRAFGPGGSATRTFMLTVTTPPACADITFAAASNFPVGTRPFSVAVGDFNGDGVQDLATSNAISNSVSVLIGAAMGSFGAASNFPVGSEPDMVAVGDFNGDGIQDLVAANYVSNTVSILTGTGTGSFGAASTFAAGSGPSAVAAGDFNNDGVQDLAVANFNSNMVSVLIGTGMGSFGAASNFPVGSLPEMVAVGDFNGDGVQDLATANEGSNNVSVLIGTGTGSFGAASDFTAGTRPEFVAVGDLNGDGVQDLAVANINSDTVSVLIGTGTGSFGAATNLPVAFGPASVAVGDFNGDGLQDLATANYNSNNLAVLTGTGTGSFGTASYFPAGTRPFSVAVGDFNGDGLQDLATSNSTSNNVSVLLRICPTGTPTPTSTSTPTPTPPPCVTAGALDASFDGDGKVTTPVGLGIDLATSVAIQSDGRIVAAGRSQIIGDTGDFAVVRYNIDGSLDTSFDGDGMVTTSVSSGFDQAIAVAIQSDGRIVQAGGAPSGFAVVRYNTDGSLDMSFDGDGIVTTTVGSGFNLATSVAIQSDGRIVAAGYSFNVSAYDFAVVRYNTDGSLDTSFDGDGVVVTPVQSGNDQASSVAIQSDGRIVVAGSSSAPNGSNNDFAMVRYNTNGSLDTSFDGDGKVTTPFSSGNDGASSVAIQSDSRIVAAGSSHNGSNNDFAVVRYNTDGSLDTSFDGDGKVTTPVGSGDDFATEGALQSDGRIVLAGYSNNGSNNDFAVARYNTDGSLDTSFDGDGKATTPIGSSDDLAFSVAIQSNGRIVSAGYSVGSTVDFAVVRYHGSATCTSPTPTSTPTATPTIQPFISGTVTYGNAIPADTRFVSNVLITGDGSPIVMATTASPGPFAGRYSLTGFGSRAYTVTPTKTGGVNGAISSFDAGRIALHVAGPPNPQLTGNQLIVADVSGNGTISSFDAGQIARYVAAVSGSGSTGNWIFMPVNRMYASITTNISGEDYSALLMGEVSGNWNNTGARTVVSGQWPMISNDGGDEPPRQPQETRLPPLLDQGGGLFVALPQMVTAVGKEIVVPVNVQGVADKGVISYEFDLRYDPSVIQPLENPVDVIGTVSRGLSVVTNASEPGLLRVVVYGAMPIDENGVLLNLRFTAVGTAGSISPLTFERIMFNEGEPQTTATDGWIELLAATTN